MQAAYPQGSKPRRAFHPGRARGWFGARPDAVGNLDFPEERGERGVGDPDA